MPLEDVMELKFSVHGKIQNRDSKPEIVLAKPDDIALTDCGQSVNSASMALVLDPSIFSPLVQSTPRPP